MSVSHSCPTCNPWPDKPGVMGADVPVRHPHCPLAPIGEPNWKRISFPCLVGDPRDKADGSFDGTYPHTSPDGEKRAGFKNPPPPGGPQ